MSGLLGVDKGIVRLFRRAEEGRAHVGLGILIDDVTIVTCAHVVNGCLGLAKFQEDAPPEDALVEISFPIIGDSDERQAAVVGWAKPGLDGLDCAVLRLTHPAPKAVGRTVITALEADDPSDHALSVYGSMGWQHPGAHLQARFTGPVGASWAQLQTTSDQVFEPGYSGGGVWDKVERACIGMVVALKSDARGTIGYFLDARRISETFSDLVPVEWRRIPVRRQIWFTPLALILFTLMLLHHLAQSSAMTPFLPWVKGDDRLAAFFGAQCFAVLGPVLMWSALSHARSFAYRPSWQRVPAVFAKGPSESVKNTRLGAAAVVVFLLVLPCLAQGRAMHEALFQNPRIYAHAESFPDVASAFTDCDVNNRSFCRNQDAGLWSVVARSPYGRHEYQFAGRQNCNDGRCAVTFFPIIQPTLLIVATAFAYLWFLLFVYALMRPWPYGPTARGISKEN